MGRIPWWTASSGGLCNCLKMCVCMCLFGWLPIFQIFLVLVCLAIFVCVCLCIYMCFILYCLCMCPFIFSSTYSFIFTCIYLYEYRLYFYKCVSLLFAILIQFVKKKLMKNFPTCFYRHTFVSDFFNAWLLFFSFSSLSSFICNIPFLLCWIIFLHIFVSFLSIINSLSSTKIIHNCSTNHLPFN